MVFLRIFKHLLPRGKAWRITGDKALRRFFEGHSDVGSDAKKFIDLVWLDIRPQSTRQLDAWEDQFALPATNLTEQGRRDRLDAAWKALGGQSPRYIQDTLRGAGFDVYVHEWWEGPVPAPGTKGCATARNPIQYLRREYTGRDPRVDCGEALAECGEAFAEAGNGIGPVGYPLVNKILTTTPLSLVLCGEPAAAAGEPSAECGNFTVFNTALSPYTVPADPLKWPYFLYIGADTIDGVARVPSPRRDEFEALCLKICPAHLWLGIIVEYT